MEIKIDLNQFCDKEMMSDALISQKLLTDDYNVFARECVAPNVRNDFMSILNEEHKIQQEIFDEAQKRGWYQVPPAEQQKIDQTKQKFSSQKM